MTAPRKKTCTSDLLDVRVSVARTANFGRMKDGWDKDHSR